MVKKKIRFATPPVAKLVIERMCEVLEVSGDQELADVVGTSRTTVTGWRGRNAVPYSVCVQVAQTCDVSMDWLLFGTALKQVADEPAGYAVSPGCDEAVLIRAIAAVRAGLEANVREMDPDDEAELVMAVYELLREGADDNSVRRVIRSAA